MIDPALHAAVSVARNEQIRSITSLKSRLIGLGFTAEEIKSAIATWANYVQETRAHVR